MHPRSGTGTCKPWALVAVISIGASIAISAGCGTYGRSRHDVDRAVHDWHRRRATLAAKHTGDSPPENVEDDAPADAPVRPLDIYIREAMARNPGIQAAIADARAKLERIPQVTSLPDPLIRTIIRPEPIQTAAGDAVFTLGVGQTIPMPARLDRKGRIAAAEARMAIEQLNATRLRVIADVERAYYRLYLADRSLELAIANRKLLEALEQVVESQYRVGKVEQQDVLRVQTELSRLFNDESRYERQHDSAAAAMNNLLDRPVASAVPVTEPAIPKEVHGRVEALIELAREHNPELAALLHQTDRDRESVKLADLGYWPDLTAGFEWTKQNGREAFKPPLAPENANRASEQGDDNWALTFQVNLPIWSQRIEAAKREARANLERTLQARRAASNMVAFRVYDAWVRVQTQQDTIQLLESTLIPQARQTYEVSLSSYQVGGTGFITVIDNWRNVLSFELMLHRETAGLETAFAELQREVGLQLVREKVADCGQVEGVQP
ncbi:MAG: TolC family protein [Planctomycetota bacterium]